MKKHTHVMHDQEEFFNQSASIISRQKNIQNKFFNNYVNKQQYDGFRWMADKKNILEYGCGTGTSLDRFFENRNLKNYKIIGVDIAEMAIRIAKKKYPRFNFYRITKNKGPQIKNNSIDAVFLFHVLHHAHGHREIFKEIYSKLNKGGQFLINDLTSRNPINRFGRYVFSLTPKLFSSKFADDLVVHDHIPEKYHVKTIGMISQLKKTGYIIQEVEYGHLYFFLFIWLDRFIPLAKLGLVRWIYKRMIAFEYYLLKYPFFQKYAEVISIKSIKK